MKKTIYVLAILPLTLVSAGCVTSVPVAGFATNTLLDPRVVTGVTGSFGCAQLAQTITDTRLRRDVLRRCYSSVDARVRQESLNAPNTLCQETVRYDQYGRMRSEMICRSSQGVQRATGRVRSALP